MGLGQYEDASPKTPYALCGRRVAAAQGHRLAQPPPRMATEGGSPEPEPETPLWIRRASLNIRLTVPLLALALDAAAAES